MKTTTTKTMVMSAVIAVAAISLTGCGIPVKLSETVDLVKDIEVPAMPQSIDDIEDIPAEFQDYVDSVDWETESQALLEELQNEEFSLEREEQFCDLPDLQKIKEEAQKRLPEFLARRVEVREVIVESIRFIADTGNFNSIINLTDVLTVDGLQYTFTIEQNSESGAVLTLTPAPPLELSDLINDPDFNGCIQNSLRISGNLPETEIKFKAVLDLDITLYLRLL